MALNDIKSPEQPEQIFSEKTPVRIARHLLPDGI